VDTPDLEHARQIAAAIPDPELPYLTLTDLGILRSVEIDKGTVVARVSPTYSGCPALDVIEQSVLDALLQAGFKARVERSMSPPWTTDWITPCLQNGSLPAPLVIVLQPNAFQSSALLPAKHSTGVCSVLNRSNTLSATDKCPHSTH